MSGTVSGRLFRLNGLRKQPTSRSAFLMRAGWLDSAGRPSVRPVRAMNSTTAWQRGCVVTDVDIARWRLRSQYLVRPHAAGAADVVRHLLGVQAENPSQSAWAVAARTRSPDPGDLAGLLDSGAVLRTHVLRPTWHYVAAEDARWLIELTAPRVLATTGRGLRQSSGMSEVEIDTASAVILDSLTSRKALTRSSLSESLADANRVIGGHDLMLLLAELELQCLVCSGPPAGGVHTYALFADRVAESRPLERDEALSRLAWRYVVGHGPATDRDLAYWATLPLADVRRGLAAVSDRLESFEHDGRRFSHLGGQQPPTGPGNPVGHLLQVLDETYRGYQDSRWMLDATGAVPRLRETFIGMALADGQLVAAMKRTTGTSNVEFTLVPHTSWTPAAQQAIETAATRYADFLGVEPIVSIS